MQKDHPTARAAAPLKFDREQITHTLTECLRWVVELTEAADAHALSMIAREHRRDRLGQMLRAALAQLEA